MNLILIEHDRGQLKRASLNAVSAARQLGRPFSLLAMGHNLGPLADAISLFGAASILLADHEALAHPLADRYAKVLANVVLAKSAVAILASSSTFSKDILPRAAALLDAPMLSDVIAIERADGEPHFRRPINAGNTIATVKLDHPLIIATIRATSFEAPPTASEPSPVERLVIDPASHSTGTEFVSREERTSTRPDISEARIVVGGGRPLKDKETFEKLIGGLADLLGGAVASTRAAVDSGIAPNDCQVGQTGKVIAPQLYFAIGISGAIQHMAGVKDSRIIVAINKDPDAPIFQSATYGLVGDLYKVLPELSDAIKRAR